MRILWIVAVAILISALSCDRSSTSGADNASAAAPEAQHAPPGDPATLPKVPADEAKISAMLRERFGEATARTIRVEVENKPAGLRIALSGEAPNEEIRVAFMKEVETRVENIKFQDFNLDIAGPVRMLLNLEAKAMQNEYVRFAPDLSFAVTRQGHVYELATGRRINRISYGPQNSQLQYMALSPDGKTLAASFRGGEIALFDMPMGRNRRTLQPPGPMTSFDDPVYVGFSPDSKQLITINRTNGDLRLWDLAKGNSKQLGSHIQPNSQHMKGDNYYVAMSPDGKQIATASDERELLLWNVESRSKQPAPGVELSAKAVAWSHDGRTIAAGRSTGDKRGVALYDVAGKTQRVLSTEQDELISGLAFSPDDKTLAVAYESVQNPVRIWEVAAGKVWQTLDEKKAAQVTSPMFSTSGAVLAIDCPGLRPSEIRLFDVSKRPGGSAAASIPRPLADVVAQDDQLTEGIANAVRHTFDPRNVETLEVTMLPDGSIKLQGKVSDTEVKRVAQRTAEVYHSNEDPGMHELNHVINELEVTGHLAGESAAPRTTPRNRQRTPGQ